MGKCTIALVQMRCDREPDANLRRALALAEQAADRGAAVVCLPELFRTPYPAQREDPAIFDWAEPIPGPSTEAFAELCRRRGIAAIVPVFERRAAGVYHNTAVVLAPDGRIAGVYRKMHIPDDPAYYEKFYFAPGDTGFRAFDAGPIRVAPLVCWDQWFPEAARLAALAGADVLFYPTAIGWHPEERDREGERQRDAWRTVQRGHAIANGVYVAAVNRIGHERPDPSAPGLIFWGSSFVADPQGVVIAEAGEDREEIVCAEISPDRTEDVRRHWPFLRDRRIDAYEGLLRRFLD